MISDYIYFYVFDYDVKLQSDYDIRLLRIIFNNLFDYDIKLQSDYDIRLNSN